MLRCQNDHGARDFVLAADNEPMAMRSRILRNERAAMLETGGLVPYLGRPASDFEAALLRSDVGGLAAAANRDHAPTDDSASDEDVDDSFELQLAR